MRRSGAGPWLPCVLPSSLWPCVEGDIARRTRRGDCGGELTAAHRRFALCRGAIGMASSGRSGKGESKPCGDPASRGRCLSQFARASPPSTFKHGTLGALWERCGLLHSAAWGWPLRVATVRRRGGEPRRWQRDKSQDEEENLLEQRSLPAILKRCKHVTRALRPSSRCSPGKWKAWPG